MSGFPRILAPIVASATILVSTSAGTAPVAAIQDATGQASVLQSVSVLNNSDLDFGELVVTAAGTAVIDPISGSTSTTGGLSPVGTAGHPALFTATGSKNSIVHVRLPTSAVTLSRVGGGGTMTVSNWTLDGSANRKIPATNAFTFAVGGTLSAGAGQADGTYTGTFQVTVQYP